MFQQQQRLGSPITPRAICGSVERVQQPARGCSLSTCGDSVRPARCPAYNSIRESPRPLWNTTMAGYPNALSCVLAVALAIQPVLAFPCACKAACQEPAKTPAKRSCCHKTEPGKSSATMVKYSPHERLCCCSDANVCACKQTAPAPRQATLQQRSHSNECATLPLSIDSISPLVVVKCHPTRTDAFLPACVSASERCIALCRLLF